MWYSVFPYSILSRCGIKHPKPSPFLGNALLFRQCWPPMGPWGSRGLVTRVSGLPCSGGPGNGYYMGRKPVVLVADPDILKQVMVKEFSSFPNRIRSHS
ncbi:thromboxane-A synthase-like [Centroberyx gerrardi]